MPPVGLAAGQSAVAAGQLPPVQAARAGGPWLCRTRVLSGLVAVTVPSGCRVMAQPQRCTAIRWWNLQSKIVLMRLVRPPLLRGRM